MAGPLAARLSFAQEPCEKEGMGNVVVNTAMRTLTRKAVGKLIKTARSSSGKKEGAGPVTGGSVNPAREQGTNLPGRGEKPFTALLALCVVIFLFGCALLGMFTDLDR